MNVKTHYCCEEVVTLLQSMKSDLEKLHDPGLSGGSDERIRPRNAGDLGSGSWFGKIPQESMAIPPVFCLRTHGHGAWQATVYGQRTDMTGDYTKAQHSIFT